MLEILEKTPERIYGRGVVIQQANDVALDTVDYWRTIKPTGLQVALIGFGGCQNIVCKTLPVIAFSRNGGKLVVKGHKNIMIP